ncbi:hypothetical protein GCM10011247_16470 [Pseudomonas plecoglossicida]|nr:hypothetical protein GCM10011247_16470 [Pseudomonas plecoglossicida]
MNIQDNSETAPNCAMLVGNRMIPLPIMFTVTSVVSPVRLIFLLASAIANSWRQRVLNVRLATCCYGSGAIAVFGYRSFGAQSLSP